MRGGAVRRELADSSTESRPGKPRRLFSFLEVDHGTGKLLQLLVGGACIRAAKEADCKPVRAFARAQVRVLPLPLQIRRRHTCAVVAQLVGYRPFKPGCAGSSPA